MCICYTMNLYTDLCEKSFPVCLAYVEYSTGTYRVSHSNCCYIYITIMPSTLYIVCLTDLCAYTQHICVYMYINICPLFVYMNKTSRSINMHIYTYIYMYVHVRTHHMLKQANANNRPVRYVCILIPRHKLWPLAMDSQTAQLELEELFTYTDEWGRERKITCSAPQGPVSVNHGEASRLERFRLMLCEPVFEI